MPSANTPLLHATGLMLLSASAVAAAQALAPVPAPASAPVATPTVSATAASKAVKSAVKAEPEPEAEMASVTVSAERPTNRIDRQVYDVKSDAASSNASLAEALNKVPSVAVDPDGTVTLRGSTNVQPAQRLQSESVRGVPR
jgi:hypothetical protein